MEDLAQTAIEAALKTGVSFADVRIENSTTTIIELNDGITRQSVASRMKGAGIRAFIDGAWAFGQTTNLTSEGLRTTGESVAKLAGERGLSVHLDGARIFNAAVALGVDVTELTRHADSVSFCLSKGLSSPVGSLVCGSSQFIAEARRNRKVLGGGMRQSGIIAAAGITALEQMVDRLAEDHDNAKRLAEGIAHIQELSIELNRIQTNIVYFDLASEKLTAEEFMKRLIDRGVKVIQTGPVRFRAVTHYGISAEDIDQALAALKETMDES